MAWMDDAVDKLWMFSRGAAVLPSTYGSVGGYRGLGAPRGGVKVFASVTKFPYVQEAS